MSVQTKSKINKSTDRSVSHQSQDLTIREIQSTPTENKQSVKIKTGYMKNNIPISKNNQKQYQNQARDYQLPPISSRMKNMVKTMNIYNFRKIPFVVAKSTTPSHNLGLNIQQVLSIMKGRQKIGNISPVMAANMGIKIG